MANSQNLVALNTDSGASGLLNITTISGNNALYVTDVNAKNNLESLQDVVEQVRDSITGNTPTLLKPVSLVDGTTNASLTLTNRTETDKMIDVSRVMNVNIFYEDTTEDPANPEKLIDGKAIAVMGRIGGTSNETADHFIDDGEGGIIRKTDYSTNYAAPGTDEVDIELYRFATRTNPDGTKNVFLLSDLNVRGISKIYLKNTDSQDLTGVKAYVAAQF